MKKKPTKEFQSEVIRFKTQPFCFSLVFWLFPLVHHKQQIIAHRELRYSIATSKNSSKINARKIGSLNHS